MAEFAQVILASRKKYESGESHATGTGELRSFSELLKASRATACPPTGDDHNFLSDWCEARLDEIHATLLSAKM